MSESPSAPEIHKARAPRRVIAATVTVSDSRTQATDKSGALMTQLVTEAGHQHLWHAIVPDEPAQIRAAVERARGEAAFLILSGGTGLSPRDSTYEVVSELLTKPLPGFGELFRSISFEEIGAAAMMSRAIAGLAGSLFIFALPGSSNGVKTAMTRLVIPELAHIAEQINRDE